MTHSKQPMTLQVNQSSNPSVSRWILSLGLLACFTFSTSLMAMTSQEKGLQIAVDNDKANTGFKSESSEMEMILINAYGDTISRKMTIQLKEVANDGDKSLIEFLWPADVKGTRMLTWSHKSENDDQWLYLPSINRIKRINSSNKSGSFMGSEFAYEDISSDEVEKYTYNLLRDDTLNDRPVWVIERVPVDTNSGYSKQITYVDKTYRFPLKVDYYDRKGDLLKRSTFSGYQQLNGFWRWGKIEMENVQTGKKSILSWSNRQLGTELADRLFLKQNLSN